MMRAREDVNIQNIKSPKWGNENKIQKYKTGEQEMVQKTKSLKWGNQNKMKTPTRVCPEM